MKPTTVACHLQKKQPQIHPIRSLPPPSSLTHLSLLGLHLPPASDIGCSMFSVGCSMFARSAPPPPPHTHTATASNTTATGPRNKFRHRHRHHH
ncbi:hypothetical protein Ga0100230_020625 [Opitutaceae bacterium TAV3]|nr:hypothetical protein Ga0100230_020625 [Opitutaceae bacterium TAV3]